MSSDPPAGALDEAMAVLRAGGVVAIPTDTVYGLAADPAIAGAPARLFAAKGRPEEVALPVLVADLAGAERLAGGLPPAARRLAAAFWPGALTLVVRRGAAAARLELGGDGESIGLRCPAHPVIAALLRRTGPLAVTSANLHGAPPLTTPAEVRRVLGRAVGAVVDGGTCAGVPSTVARVSPAGAAELLRPGPLSLDDLLAVATGE